MVDNPYEIAAAVLIRESGCTVREYRKGNSGRAYTADDWGIDVPRPRGPISFGTFAHEVAHQLLHRYGSRQRWVEEVEAEEFAIKCFDRFDLDGRERYEQNATRHLAGSFMKAVRRSGRLAAVIKEKYPEWWRRVGELDTYPARWLREREEVTLDVVQGHHHR